MAVVLLTALPAQAGELRIVHYDVYGRSIAELRESLNENGPRNPRDLGGKRFHGWTDWRVDWTYKYTPSKQGCRFTEFTSALSGTMTLPRWTPIGGGAEKVARAFDTYVSALRRHEHGHYAIGAEAAAEIQALGHAFSVPSDCSTIANAFEMRAAAILEAYRAKELLYDRETEHGRTQGARF
ncbi:MAG TPA: DUF922 domain-containing protein [Pseudoxanthomonas sp.]|nr:DUF922 domain-containing protein [Pseudoxanthomonas sp.]